MATIHRQQLSSLPVCWGGGRVPGGDLSPGRPEVGNSSDVHQMDLSPAVALASREGGWGSSTLTEGRREGVSSCPLCWADCAPKLRLWKP